MNNLIITALAATPLELGNQPGYHVVLSSRLETVIRGAQRVALAGGVSQVLAAIGAVIIDFSQFENSDCGVLVFRVDPTGCDIDLDGLRGRLNRAGDLMGARIRLQHEDVFAAMHRI